MKDMIFNLVLEDSQYKVLDDGTLITFFPKINYAYIDTGITTRWIFGSSMSSIITTYYMDMDSHLLLEELYA